MISRAVYKHQRARKPLAAFAILALVTGVLASSSAVLAVHDDNLFELDKNATNNLNVTRLGQLGSNINATTTSINVCRADSYALFTSEPGTPFTIQVEAERMTVTAAADGSFGGNCSGGTKRTYTVTRGVAGGGAAASHQASGVEGLVSLVVAAPGKPGTDWDQVRSAVQADPNTKCISLGLVECAFIQDGIGPTTFIGGASKDHLPISGWQESSGASPDKAEILNAFAAKGISGDNQILYFGMDRYAVDGSTDIGFWFFKNPVALDGSGGFTGEHAVGDLLILGTFTQGGATSNVRVFQWVGTGGNESDTIEGPSAAYGDCVPGAADDDGCATVNDTSISVNWNLASKGVAAVGWRPAGGFFEGGIDLTASGLEGCFSSFLAETRSSPEITAILKDFALGSFEACGSTTTTTPKQVVSGNNVAIPAAGTSITTSGSIQVKDEAVVAVNGTSSFGGSVTFFLCGPTPLADTSYTLCSSGGTQIGSAKTVTPPSPVAVTSDAATITSAGRYCWRAAYSGDSVAGVPGSSDSAVTECFKVLPVQPTLSTQAIDSSGAALTGAVPFGQPIFDKATLTGTANKPGTPVINPTTVGGAAGGTITFKLYGPSTTGTPTTTQCAALPLATNFPTAGITRTVSGDSSASNVYSTIGDGFTPAAPGFYFWKAAYSGDSPNTLSATHNDDCSDANERVEVQQLQPTMDTAQQFVPNDAATISVASGAGDLAGSVVFKLYVGAAAATCSGTPAYTSSAIDITTGTGTGLSRTVVSNNTTAYTTSTSFAWVVEYTTTNAAHKNVTSPCGNEVSSITINNGSQQSSG